MKFSVFLKSFEKDNSPVGDLARDFMASKSKATTYNGVKNALDRNCACCGAYEALERAYELYKKQL